MPTIAAEAKLDNSTRVPRVTKRVPEWQNEANSETRFPMTSLDQVETNRCDVLTSVGPKSESKK
jgi:hypothetical protein